MSAITASLLATLRAGDHLLAQDCLYGGTLFFVLHELPRLGIDVTLVDLDQPRAWSAALRPTTRAFYVEGITNPLMGVGDLAAVVEFARAHGLVSMIDNTIATPVNFLAARFGFDLVLHSATKYLNGHSDIVAGSVAGSTERVTAVRHALNHYGGSLDPHACFLLERGLKTLSLRVRYQGESALRIARFLAEHPRVKRVNYPGLPGTASHDRASRWFTGFGGMLSFELASGGVTIREFLSRMSIALVAPSLGGAESLITQPSRTSHAGLSPEERTRVGITDELLRLSVGLESTDDLIDDLNSALS
jgi:cystathionine gamma-synthase/cystathionine gamma-lyase/cystathionine beta-lyase